MRPLLVVVVVLAALFVFAPSLGYEFIYDDHVQIQANPWLQSPDGFRQLFTRPFWAFFQDRGDLATNYYRPLCGGLYALTARAFGVAPLPFHAVSFALHTAVALLACGLLLRLRRAPGERAAAAAGPLLATGLVFATHPAHAEAVAWVGGQADLLAALFSLLALRAYLASRDSNRESRRRLALVLGPLAFLLAALSKETGVAFVLVPIAVELGERRLPGPALRGWRGACARLGGYALALALYLALRLHALGSLAPRHYGVTGGEGEAIAYAFALLGRYLLYLVAPFPPRVLAQVPRRSPLDAATLAGLGAALLLAVLAVVLIRRGRGPRELVVPLAFGVAFLLPVLAADSIGGANFAERYLYLPSIGLAWLAGAVWARLLSADAPPRERLALTTLGLALVAFLGVAAAGRARIYRDDLTLFSAAVASAPGSYIAHHNLGMALFGEGRLAEAEAQYRAALRIAPRSVAARANLGLIEERRGHPDRSRRLYEEALSLSPRHALAALQLSRLESAGGDRSAAARVLDRLFAAGGESYDTLCARAEIWIEEGQPERAETLFRRAAAGFPDRPHARRLLASIGSSGSGGSAGGSE